MKIDLQAKKTSSSEFHGVNFKERTNNSETLVQETQTTALMNYSYVSNEVFDVFYVDYIEFKKYADDIINSLNVKNRVYEISGSKNDQSKLKFLKVEILKLQTYNASLKEYNKFKSKIIKSLTTC